MTEQSSQCDGQPVNSSIPQLILGSEEGGTRPDANISHHMTDNTSQQVIVGLSMEMSSQKNESNKKGKSLIRASEAIRVERLDSSVAINQLDSIEESGVARTDKKDEPSQQMQKSARSTVLSHVIQKTTDAVKAMNATNDAKSRHRNPPRSSSGQNFNSSLRQSHAELQRKHLDVGQVELRHILIEGEEKVPHEASSGKLVESGKKRINRRKTSVVPVGMLKDVNDKDQKVIEAISQTIFSSYNDSDSDQTLRFNRHVSRMSLPNSKQEGAAASGAKRDQNESRKQSKKESKARKQVADRLTPRQPSNLEVKTKPSLPPAPQHYQPLTSVNMSDMTSGIIPMTSIIDAAGNYIENAEEKIKATERVLNRERSTATIRSPAGDRSARATPGMQSPTQSNSNNATHNQSSPYDTQWGQISASGMIKFGKVVGNIFDGNDHALSNDVEFARKSPFQGGQSSPQRPKVQVIQQVLGPPEPVVRRHQSPPAYNIASLPQHLNKSSSNKQLQLLKQNKSVSSLGQSMGEVGAEYLMRYNQNSPHTTRDGVGTMPGSPINSKNSKRQLLLGHAVNDIAVGGVGNRTLMPGIIYHVLNEEPLQSNEGSDMHIHTVIGDSFLGQGGFEGAPDVPPPTITIGQPTIMIGIGANTTANQRAKLSGVFTNSSQHYNDTVTQNMMHLSGMSNRKQLMHDGRGPFNQVDNETFQSIITEQKTTIRQRAQDLIAGGYRETQFFEKPIIIKNYQTPQRERPVPLIGNQGETTFFKETTGSVPPNTTLQQQESRQAESDKRGSEESRLSLVTGTEDKTFKPSNTLEQAADRNMFGKTPVKPEPFKRHFSYISDQKAKTPKAPKLAQTVLPPLNERRRSEDHRLVMNAPKSLYFTNGYMPKIADLRDALRNNSMYHSRFNPELETDDFKKLVGPALKKQLGEVDGKVDEELEQGGIHEILIPLHQEQIDRKRAKHEKEKAYWAGIKTQTQQVKTMDRLIGIKTRNYAKFARLKREDDALERSKARQFKAMPNPHVNNDTAEDIAMFLDLKVRMPRRNALFNFIAHQRFNDINMPSSMFDVEPAWRKRIEKIIAEENKKMRSNDNDAQQLDRLKRQVEDLVEQGFTFKKPVQKRVKFANQTEAGETAHGAYQSEIEPESAQLAQTKRRLSMSPSFGNLSLKSTSARQKRLLDPTIVDNDYEAPMYQEPRARPSPAFQPIGSIKPKLLMAAQKRKGVPQVQVKVPTEDGRAESQQPLGSQSQTNSQLNQDILLTPKEPNSADQSEALASSTKDVAKSINVDEIASQGIIFDQDLAVGQAAALGQTQTGAQGVRMSKNDIRDLRKSKDQAQKMPFSRQTHHSALRVSKEGALEYEPHNQEEKLTMRDDEEQLVRASSSGPERVSDSVKEDGAQDSQNTHNVRHSLINAKLELQQEVRKSLIRDASAILMPTNLPGNSLIIDNAKEHDAISDPSQFINFGRVLGQSTSQQIVPLDSGTQPLDEDAVKQATTSLKMPFLANVSQDVSARQLSSMQPSIFGSLPLVRGQAREKLMKEKRIEMLHKPDLNKSSCNHCITKAVQKHDVAMERIANSSIAGSTAAGTVAARGGQTALNNAITEFLSVMSPSEAPGHHLEHNFSNSYLPPTSMQFDSTTMLQSEQVKIKAYESLAKNAQSAIKGLLATCDTHVKITKHLNEEFNQDFKKQHEEAEHLVHDAREAIDAIQSAPDEVPSWEQIKEYQKLEKANDKEVIEEMVELKRNVNPQLMIDLIKQNQGVQKMWRPVKVKHTTEINQFLSERFDKVHN